MDWIQFIIFVLGNMVFALTLWLWNRTESRADNRHMDNKLESTRALVQAIHEDGRTFRESMAAEMKDFHYRLLEIERNRS
ncbi:MAG TPA: hypothetical protein VMR37_08455 [Rhabdochlamydiaceae bacterium]|nr:hypothetical protein [Rhabdochlamydiaceae bacterium]